MKKKGRTVQVLASFLFLFTLLLCHGHLKAQSKMVNMEFKDASFIEVINAFRQQTGMKFLYNLEKVKNKRCTNLIIRNKPAMEAIDIALKHFKCTYSIVEGVVTIKDEEVAPTQPVKTITGEVRDESGTPLPGVTVLLKGTQVGVATDVNGKFTMSIPASSKHTLIFTFIGMEKKEITVDGEKPISVTMRYEETALDEVTVVSTGYQTLNRKDMVGSYTTLKADDIMMHSYSSIDQMLQGRVPGMIVVNTSSRVGRAPKITIRGQSTILGNTDPLWVIDGVIQADPMPFNTSSALTEDLSQLVGNQVSWLNPEDIETVTILKDASATAVYGAKASNGVIVITTKKGKADRMRVHYSANLSLRLRPHYSNFNYMNSRERIQFSKEAYDAGARYQTEPLPQIYTYEGLMSMYNDRLVTEDFFVQQMELLETVNTDWLDILTHNAFSHNHNLSFSGGSEKMTYNVSFNYTSQKGFEIGNETERFTGRINLDTKLRKNVRANFTLYASLDNSDGFGPGVNPMGYATKTSRSIPAYNADGSRTFYQTYEKYKYNGQQQALSFNFENERDNSYARNEANYFDVSVNFDWDITSDFTYQFVGDIMHSNNESEAYAGEKTQYIARNYRGYDYGTESNDSEKYKASMLPFGGELLKTGNKLVSYNMQHKVLFSKTLNDSHRINAMIGLEIRSEDNASTSNTVWGYVPERGEKIMQPRPYDEIVPLNGADLDANSKFGVLSQIYNGSWYSTTMTNNFIGYFFTLAYSFNDRYVLNANVRGDASNRFGQDVNKQFDPAFSFGFSWRMGEENFVKNNLTWLNQLNLKATWGIQGNVVTSISPDLIVKQEGVSTYFDEYYLSISSLPNPYLKWERTHTWNLGLDLQLFNGITMNLDYYGRYSNAIIDQDVPNEYGTKTLKLNGGRIQNHGIEFSMNLTPYQRDNFAWTVGINASKNWNRAEADDITNKTAEITKNDFLNGSGTRQLKKGYPLNAFWSYSFAGLDPETGYPTFNYMDVEERHESVDPTTFLVYSGQTEPYFTGGLNTRIRYRSFSIGADFALLLGAKKRLPNPYSGFSSGTRLPDPLTNLSKDLNKRWKKPGDENRTNIPALFIGDSQQYQMELPDGKGESIYTMWASSDVRVGNASFLRCTNMSATWNVPQALCAHIGVSSLSLSGTVNNLFLIANKCWNGFDPELGTSITPKTFSFRLSVGF